MQQNRLGINIYGSNILRLLPTNNSHLDLKIVVYVKPLTANFKSYFYVNSQLIEFMTICTVLYIKHELATYSRYRKRVEITFKYLKFAVCGLA